jgi:hypothetical protein
LIGSTLHLLCSGRCISIGTSLMSTINLHASAVGTRTEILSRLTITLRHPNRFNARAIGQRHLLNGLPFFISCLVTATLIIFQFHLNRRTPVTNMVALMDILNPKNIVAIKKYLAAYQLCRSIANADD